jgi:hypothetical protein
MLNLAVRKVILPLQDVNEHEHPYKALFNSQLHLEQILLVSEFAQHSIAYTGRTAVATLAHRGAGRRLLSSEESLNTVLH